MKGARFILPGCTGFHVRHPEWGELEVLGMQHYRVICKSMLNPLDLPIYIPMRDFEVLNYPRDENCNKDEKEA